jgi:hypothetical protein
MDTEANLKCKFLQVYRKRLTPHATCSYLKITRRRFELWRREDADFRESCQVIEADIVDRIRLLAYEKLGLVKKRTEITDKHTPQQLMRLDNQLITLFLRMQAKEEDKALPPTRKIPGLPENTIANLTQPDRPAIPVTQVPVNPIAAPELPKTETGDTIQ